MTSFLKSGVMVSSTKYLVLLALNGLVFSTVVWDFGTYYFVLSYFCTWYFDT